MPRFTPPFVLAASVVAMIRRRACAIVGFLVVSTGALACHAVASCHDIPQVGLDAFDAPGPHPVGVRTVTFVDASRPTPAAGGFAGAPERTLVTEIWYPALTPGRDAAVDAAGGPYPVVVYSHGAGGGQRLEAELLGQHLASRGMIVAAADYPLIGLAGVAEAGPTAAILRDLVNEPADWSFVLDGVLATFSTAADPDRIGATGHSFGGILTLLVTFHRELRDPRIRAALPLAPSTCFLTRRFFAGAATPLLIMAGDSDQIARFREEARTGYRRADRPRFLVRVENGSHLGFLPVAAALDPTTHYDQVGCDFLRSFITDIPSQAEDFWGPVMGPVGDEMLGIRVRPRRCPVPCSGTIPTQPAMLASRQLQLTRVTEAAYFEAYLRGDDSARCFLRDTLGREPDMKVKSAGAGQLVQ